MKKTRHRLSSCCAMLPDALLTAIIALVLLSIPQTIHAQEWTVVELPDTYAEVPALIQEQFGCTYEELPEKKNITHLRIVGTDFGRTDYNNDGREALRALARKAIVIDMSELKDNPETQQWYAESDWYKDDYPGPTSATEYIALGADSVEHFIFPKTLTRISNTLGEKRKLTQVTWPNQVVELSSSLFYNCRSLKQIAIPEGVTQLSSGIFSNCQSLTSITLPSTLKTIDEKAFEFCSALESLTLPDSVETLGFRCFIYCEKLKDITLPQTITKIGDDAFYYCKSLPTVTLPPRIKAISNSMFCGCDSLTSIVIPDSVETIKNSAFYQCKALKRITMPAGLKSIGGYAFYETGLEEFDMPDSVSSIGEHLFDNCMELRRVHLSRALTTIPTQCFGDCQLLEEVNIPYRVTRIEDDAFLRCYQLPSPVLPDGITHIGAGAFRETCFDYITLPKNLQFIGGEAFRYSHLKSIDVPAKVVEIKNGAFQDCDSLKHATLPEGLLYLHEWAFSDDDLLEDVTLPSTLRFLGGYVFHYNKSKKSYVQPPLINTVPSSICSNCDSLTSVTLHSNVTLIDGSAFNLCPKLTRIDLPEGLEVIGTWAFAETALKEINLPASLKKIEERAFCDIDASRVVVPEGVEYIGDRAFYSKNLRYVDFPSTVALLGGFAFQGDGGACDSIILRAAVPPRNWGDLYRTWLTGSLYVPEASVNAYKQNEGFNTSFTSIKPLKGYAPENIIVATPASTDSIWFPTPANANLTIAYNPDYSDGFYGGHLHVGKNTNWPVNHLRYDYRLSWNGWDEQATATLINEGTMTAQTMEMNLEYERNQWFFFTPPFDMKASDFTCNDSRAPFVLRTFSGAQRAAGNHYRVWQDVSANDTLKTGQGYILQYGVYRYLTGYDKWSDAKDDQIFNMKASAPLHTMALTASDVTIPLTEYKGQYAHNEGWNLIGNPYMAYFDISELETDGPILVATKEPYTALEAISPLDDRHILHPLRAFLVQRSNNQTSVTFHAAGRQADRQVREASTNDSRSLRRAALRQQRIVFDAMLQRHTEKGDSLLARTRIVQTPRATESYDRGQDAPFITMDDNATALYSRTNGLRYSMNELPLTTATVELGMHLQEAGSYTIAMNVRGEAYQGLHLWLKDTETGTETDLLTDSYTFTVSEPCTLNNRFVLSLNDGITSVPTVETKTQQAAQQIYDLQGRRVNTPGKGLYIKNGKKVTQY